MGAAIYALVVAFLTGAIVGVVLERWVGWRWRR